MSDQSSEPSNVVAVCTEPPNIAFRQLMAAVEIRCKRLREAIDNHDFEGTENTAQDATNTWLAGRLACQRFLNRASPASPYGDAACKLLQINGTAILALINRAVSTIEVPQMQKTLEELRRMLTTAMSEPLQPSKGKQGA